MWKLQDIDKNLSELFLSIYSFTVDCSTAELQGYILFL
jgi:hypothetical protein